MDITKILTDDSFLYDADDSDIWGTIGLQNTTPWNDVVNDEFE